MWGKVGVIEVAASALRVSNGFPIFHSCEDAQSFSTIKHMETDVFDWIKLSSSSQTPKLVFIPTVHFPSWRSTLGFQLLLALFPLKTRREIGSVWNDQLLYNSSQILCVAPQLPVRFIGNCLITLGAQHEMQRKTLWWPNTGCNLIAVKLK